MSGVGDETPQGSCTGCVVVLIENAVRATMPFFAVVTVSPELGDRCLTRPSPTASRSTTVRGMRCLNKSSCPAASTAPTLRSCATAPWRPGELRSWHQTEAGGRRRSSTTSDQG
jgi:hypothetical protein